MLKHSATILFILNLASVTEAAPINLITNGSFENGNTGFTSDYSYILPSDNDNQYYVLNNPSDWYFQFQSFGDHTSGSGLMYLGNGSVDGGVAYTSNAFDIIAGQVYQISGWFTSLGCSTCIIDYGNSSIDLMFRVSGIDYWLTQGITDNSQAGNWSPFNITEWVAPISGSANLIIGTQPGQWSGNDFALDDLSVTTEPVPEPASLVLLSFGLLGIARRLRKI